MSLFTNTDNQAAKHTNTISRSAFPEGYCIYCIDIDGHASDYSTNKPHYGLSRLIIRFGEPLTHSVSVICYAKYDATIKIDKTRNVHLVDKPVMSESK